MQQLNWENKFQNKLNLTENNYNTILKTINNEENKNKLYIIPIEIKRTLKKEFIEQNPSFASNLEEVLKIFVLSNGPMGYKSGMSFIGKMILKLTNNDKVKTFIILRKIFENKYIKDIYMNNFDYIKETIDKKFKEKMPLLYNHFEKNKINLYMIYGCTWVMTLFSNLKCDVGEYIFKLFIESGEDFNIYFDSIFAILKIFENELLNKKDLEIYSFQIDENIDMNRFIDNLNNFNK